MGWGVLNRAMTETSSMTSEGVPRVHAASPLAGFRYDINALRAIAVVAVLLFHFKVPGFSGGFVGVDVFFVISGLLMTRIIDKGIGAGNFSLLGFYGARFKRIVPALAVLCIAVLALVLSTTDPLTAGEASQAILAALTFTSNHLFASQQGYFASASEENWMLHSWTLSVEWQFYMLYPVVLLMLTYSDRLWAWRRAILVLGFAVSFAIAFVFIQIGERFEQQAFFILPTRAWEMIAGGIVALTPLPASRAARQAMVALGLAALGWSIFSFSDTLNWPWVYTLLPVGGTALILAAQQGDDAWTRLPGMQPLGTWSYSIYLWHWPIVVALGYFEFPHSAIWVAAGIATSVLLGWLSYSLVETRLRAFIFDSNRRARTQWQIAFGAFAMILLTAGIGWKSDGLAQVRTAGFSPETRARLADYKAATTDWVGIRDCADRTRVGESQRCNIIGGGRKRVLLLGDSYVEQTYPRVARLAERNGIDVTLLFQPGCPPLPDIAWPGRHDRCAKFFDAAREIVAQEKFDKIVIFSAWGFYFNALKSSPLAPCRLTFGDCTVMSPDQGRAALDTAFDGLGDWLAAQRAHGRDIVLILPRPTNTRLTPELLYQYTFDAGQPVLQRPVLLSTYNAQMGYARALLMREARRSDAKLVDPTKFRCGVAGCPAYEYGKFLFRDRHHIRASLIGSPRFAFIDAAIL
jgi:peptidoglycan/LPS O-acetylase OafA/YrhL